MNSGKRGAEMYLENININMQKHIEIFTIEHKGVKVTIRINYDKGTASLMESVDGAWKPKKWIFSERGLEYMNVWQNVLEAMQVAVAECKKELEKDLAENNKFSKEFIADLIPVKRKK